MPGWFIVAPARHVEQIDALDPQALHELGPLVAEVAAALRAETPCAKVYVSVFAEVLHHFHVHVIARPPGLAAEWHGPRLFLAEGTADPEETAALARRVFARLATTAARLALAPRSPASPPPAAGPSKSRPLRAALLSGLVCPGLGQIANGQIAKGVALVVLVLGVVGWMLARMAAVVTASLPADTTTLDIFQAYDLALEIQQRNSGAFSGALSLLVVLWVYATVDAWWGARRPAPGASKTSPAGVG